MIVATDLFGGAGGWAVGLASLGVASVSIELDPVAAATAAANGHPTVIADVAATHPALFRAHPVQVGSPPCQGFSIAGLGAGRGDAGVILAALDMIAAGAGADAAVAHAQAESADHRSALVLQPLRWTLDTLPEWIAWEQVPPVLPLWQRCAELLRAAGYTVWTGVLHSEQYGVPQTRRRAVLIASRVRAVGMPRPTHSRYHSRHPQLLDPGVLPFVPMAEAVGWGYTDRPAQGLVSVSGGGPRLLDGGSGAWRLVLRAMEEGRWVRRLDRADGPFNRGEVSTCSARDGAVLQSFPAGYRWRGTATQQAGQIGNAVPPLLARAICAEAGGIPA